LFYGPNGYGKSTILEAIRITSNPLVFKDRVKGAELYLKPWTYDNDYDSASANIRKERNELYVHAIYDDDKGQERNVVLANDGFIVNELEEQHRGHSFYADADNPINWAKFQLHEQDAKRFVELAEAIYGFEVDLGSEVKDSILEADGSKTTHLFYQDIIISKGKDKVHFCRMSAGEKKIATLIRQLCDPDSLLGRDIVLIDNMEMHVYFKRHPIMLAKLQEHFKGKQFFATTHSSVMVDAVPPQCRYDLERFRPEYKCIGA
jgi:predicted ATP-binding protein involved in virulence